MLIGTDPEFFIVNSEGRPRPAHLFSFIPNKEDKKKHWANGRFFRDSYALEINTVRAYDSTDVHEMFCDVGRSISTVNGLLPKGHKLVASPCMDINPEEDLKDAPPDVMFGGCEPTFDAYEMAQKSPNVDFQTWPNRWCGGHLHFSTNHHHANYAPAEKVLLDPERYPDIVKLMDRYIELPLTHILNSPAIFKRREVYGQPGEFRPQIYGDAESPTAVGVEYRPPSPEIFTDEDLLGFAIDRAGFVIENFGSLLNQQSKAVEDEVRGALITGENLPSVAERLSVTDQYKWGDIELLRLARAA